MKVLKETFSSSFGDSVRGYIQELGTDQFRALFYKQDQVEFFQDRCSSESSVLHVDCIGSVMKHLPEQKVPYYYAMVLSDHSMPECEFITTYYRHAWIMSVTDIFLAHVTSVNSGRRTNPHVVVVVFSYAMRSC